MHTCADIISSVPFFEDAEEGFTTSLVTCLTPQVSLKGDIIVREGEVSREMYFIKSGAAQVDTLPSLFPDIPCRGWLAMHRQAVCKAQQWAYKSEICRWS